MNKERIISSPVDGKVITLEEVNDGVFSEKMLGDGIAILPMDHMFYAPISGEIVTLFPTGHAYGIKGKDGTEILVHIGVDTVEIEESVFQIFCKQGQTVQKGDLIVQADLDKISTLGYQTYTMVISVNKSLEVISKEIDKTILHGNPIMKLENKKY